MMIGVSSNLFIMPMLVISSFFFRSQESFASVLLSTILLHAEKSVTGRHEEHIRCSHPVILTLLKLPRGNRHTRKEKP
jgi:hypothetical protein